MAEVIRMPEVIAGAAEAVIQLWLVAQGAIVTAHHPLAEIETEKATVEFRAEADGIVGRILANEGDTVMVGDPILIMITAGEGDVEIDAALQAEGIAALRVSAPERSSVAIPLATVSTCSDEEVMPAGAVPVADVLLKGARLFASPLVRRLARENRIDLTSVAGTGPNGRIVRRDLELHIESTVAGRADVQTADTPAISGTPDATAHANFGASSYEDIPLDRMRKAIARRLTESKSTVPHFYLVADCRVDDLLTLRAQVNSVATRKISLNDFILKAVAGAHVKVPAANAIWNGESIRRFSSVDVAVAVATEGGLSTPVVRGVEGMNLTQLSLIVADLATRAREGHLRQHELVGGSVTVSNLGMYGTAQFSAILNPPQASILAVGAVLRKPVIAPSGELEVGQIMTVTLSADHRVLDGAVAAEWLAAFQQQIENPLSTLV